MTRLAWLAFLMTRGALFALVYTGHKVHALGQDWWPGGRNVILYTYFAEVVERGGNPYTMVGGPVGTNYADYPPLLMALFGLLAKVVDPRLGVLIVCFAGDIALFAATLAVAKRRTGLDFYATVALVLLNPFWIGEQLYQVQYKTWLAAGVVVLAVVDSPVIVGALTGAFMFPALLLPLRLRQGRNWRAAAVAGAVAMLCWLPYLPEAWGAIGERRADRYAMAPYGPSILAAVPAQAQLIALSALTALAVMLVVRRGNALLSACAAMTLVANLSPEVSINRTLALALPALIAAPMTGKARLSCFALCCIGWIAYLLRWYLPPYDASVTMPLWLWAAIHLPEAAAVVIAWRASPSPPSQA